MTHPKPSWVIGRGYTGLIYCVPWLNCVPLVVQHEAAVSAQLFEMRGEVLRVQASRRHARSLHDFDRRGIVRSAAFRCALKDKRLGRNNGKNYIAYYSEALKTVNKGSMST